MVFLRLAAAGAVALLLHTSARGAQVQASTWVATWACSQQLVEVRNLPPAPAFTDTTIRQLVRVSIGGRQIRVRFSNAFGNAPLTLQAARIARPLKVGTSDIDPATDRPLTFGGRRSVTIPVGAMVVSDTLDVDLSPLADVAITIHVRGAPSDVTGHPGSRTTSFFQAGADVSASALPSAARVERWYFLSGIDVMAGPGAAAVAVMGDSITDGRGSTTDGNNRWTDTLARRLLANDATRQVAVLNHGLGGNRLLSSGLGPNALARIERDVIAQPGVKWLVILEGINDIGARPEDRVRGRTPTTAEDIIFALSQIIDRVRTHGILVYGATIMPFEGLTDLDYFTPEGEADRQQVNDWIRKSGRFDAVIDFDAVTRDPAQPSRLAAAVDVGDHLHPSAAGHRLMGEAVDLRLFTAR
jgi:lysophospholipase L1-like esterase